MLKKHGKLVILWTYFDGFKRRGSIIPVIDYVIPAKAGIHFAKTTNTG